MANWYDRQSKASLAAHILSQETEIARLTAALAEAEARAYARGLEDAAQYHERHAKGYANCGARQDAAQHMQHAAAIRALAKKETGE